MSNYNVVFEYTSKAGSYAGARYRTPFPSEEEFLKHKSEIEAEGSRTIVAQGVTDAESLRLCEQGFVGAGFRVAEEASCYGTDNYNLELHQAVLAPVLAALIKD
jgi:hypothetical protein